LEILGSVLRLVSYLYHFVLSLFLFLVSVIVLIGGKHDMNLTMLPWTDAQLTYWVFGLSLLGLLTTTFAAIGKLRFLFPFWCAFVLIMMIRGFFLSPYYYGSPEKFQMALWLTAGALVTFLGSLTLFKSRKSRR
jgi:hypothetical protein